MTCAHVWPDELTPDAACLGCGLTYSEWSEEDSMESPRDVVGAVLPKSWSQDKRDTMADEIVDALYGAGFVLDEQISTVEVGGALVPVETVEAYGLEIRLDALGDASEISHPAGLVVLA